MKISYENKCLVIAWCCVPRHGQQNELESPPGSELNATLPDFLRGDAQCWRLGCAGTMLEAEIIDGLQSLVPCQGFPLLPSLFSLVTSPVAVVAVAVVVLVFWFLGFGFQFCFCCTNKHLSTNNPGRRGFVWLTVPSDSLAYWIVTMAGA